MKKHVIPTAFPLVAAAMLALAFTAMAQPPMMERPSPQSRVDEMDKVLKLSDDQKTKILKIYTDADASMPQGGGMGGQGGPGGPGGAGFAGGVTDDGVEKVLTPEQVTTWRTYLVEKSVERRMTQIDAAVALTDSQKALVKPVIEKEIAAQRELMSQRRSGDGDREAMRSKMDEIRTATATALASILTKEQLDKYNAMPRGGMRRQQ